VHRAVIMLEKASSDAFLTDSIETTLAAIGLVRSCTVAAVVNYDQLPA